MRRRQSGFFLVGATIAVAVVGILLTLWMNQRMQEMRIQRAEHVGSALKMIGDSVESFIVEHHDEIDKALGGDSNVVLTEAGKPSDIGVSYAPDSRLGRILTIAVGGNVQQPPSARDIIRIMRLPAVGDQPPLPGATYTIRIYRPANDVNIRAIVYLDKTLRNSYGHEPNWNMLGVAIRKIGIHGGLSLDGSTDHFTFPLTPSGNPQIPNQLPNPDSKPGLLAVRTGYLLSPLNRYLRRDGALPMKGPLDMGENDVKNARQISANSLSAKEDIMVDRQSLVGGVEASTTAEAIGVAGTPGWVIAGKGVASGQILAGSDATMVAEVKGKDGIVAASNGVWSYGNLWAEKHIYNRDGNLTVHGKSAGNGHISADGSISAGRNIHAQGDIASDGKISAKGNLLAEGSINIVDSSGRTVTSLGKDRLALGDAITAGDRCGTAGQLGRDSQGMFYVCLSGRWDTLKGDPGNRGDQGATGGIGVRGPKGDDFKPEKSWITTYETWSCAGSAYTVRSSRPHDFCTLNQINQHKCPNSGYYSYAEVLPADTSIYSPLQNVGKDWEKANWYYVRDAGTGGKRYYELSIINLGATMTCMDFD